MSRALKVRGLAREIALLFGAGVAATVTVPVAQAQEAQRLDRVEVTGSAIRRVQAETPAPVQIITRREIERTGAASVNELMRSIPAMDIYDQGELASNSPSGSGTGNALLRGLPETSVLVLLNGRRLPANALQDGSGAGAAVDLNMIPLSAIERVEILRDGASAIYGADAVAGVVNFITRRDYTGIEGRLGFGQTKYGDGTEKNVGVSLGFGNYDKDRYNVFVTLDQFKRDPIYRKDREVSSSVDFRRYGGRDLRSSFSPYGNVIDPNTGAFTGATIQPCPPELYSGGRCRYDFNNSVLTMYNPADRLGGMVSGQFKVTDSVRATAQYFFSEAKNNFQAHPVPDFFTLANGDTIAGRFMQGGPRVTDRKSKLDQFVFALDGTVGKLDWNIDAGQGRSRITNRDSNYFDANKWQAALDASLIDPTVSTNPQALVDGMKVNPLRVGELKSSFVNLKVSGELGGLKLPGGAVLFAAGAQYLRETLVDTPDELTQRGEVVGSIQQAAVNAGRNSKALFAELALPFTKTLEGQAAVRYDNYPNASATSPKIALKWTAMPNLAFRASVTDSFRVPTLKQLYGAQEQGAVNVSGAANCRTLGLPADCDISAFEVSGGNQALKPEKGRTLNLGTIFSLGQNFNGIIDLWKLKIDDQIDQPTISQAVQGGFFGRDPKDGRFLVFTNLQNFAKQEVSGVDVDLRYRMPRTAIGNVQLRALSTYYIQNRRYLDADAGWEKVLGSYINPRFRYTLTATVDRGPWAGTLAYRYTGSFRDSDVYPSNTQQLPDGTRKVGAFSEVDLLVSYSGVKNLRLDFGVRNLFNEMPPYSEQNASSNKYTQMGFAELYSARGRFFYARATYQFK